MRLNEIIVRGIQLLGRFGLLFCALSVISCAIHVPLHPAADRADWVAGQEALQWQTELVDADRTAHYHLTLQPLWYVEGGICAMEIMVSDLSHPDRNLLGKPVVSALQPFVITVEELEAGIENSRFGTVRKFRLPNATKQTLTVRILASKVGDRGGGVPGVPRIESLTLAFAVTSH